MWADDILLHSPFGAPAEDVFKSDVAVLIGAGIGVTVSGFGKPSVKPRL